MPPSHVERLHILSLQLDGTHGASLSTFYVPLFKKPLVFSKPGHAPSSTANIPIFTPGAIGFFGPVCMYVCMYICVHECVYVAQRASERHREAQRGPERPREPIVHMYVERPRMSERG